MRSRETRLKQEQLLRRWFLPFAGYSSIHQYLALRGEDAKKLAREFRDFLLVADTSDATKSGALNALKAEAREAEELTGWNLASILGVSIERKKTVQKLTWSQIEEILSFIDKPYDHSRIMAVASLVHFQGFKRQSCEELLSSDVNFIMKTIGRRWKGKVITEAIELRCIDFLADYSRVRDFSTNKFFQNKDRARKGNGLSGGGMWSILRKAGIPNMESLRL